MKRRAPIMSGERCSVFRMLLLQVPFLIAACSSVGPEDSSYSLVSVNGDSLPAPFALAGESPPVFEALSGRLTLVSDTTLTALLVVRCRENLPPSTGCTVRGDGRITREGVYSRSEGWVRFAGEGADPERCFPCDGRWPATFSSDSAMIRYNFSQVGSPPAQSVLVFRR